MHCLWLRLMNRVLIEWYLVSLVECFQLFEMALILSLLNLEIRVVKYKVETNR